jgi:sortase A
VKRWRAALRRSLSVLLLLLAICFLAEGIWIEAKAWLAQGLIATAWELTDSQGDAITPWPGADTWPVSKLEAPRLGVKRYILAGVSGRTLAFAPGWAMHSAPPGSSGTTLLAGHRDTHFHFLKALRQGDRLLIESPGNEKRAYRVTSTEVVRQLQGGLILTQGVPGLLLVTCYPFDALMPGGELRYLVRAEAESGERIGLKSTLNQSRKNNLNEADPHIPPSRLPASRLSG